MTGAVTVATIPNLKPASTYHIRVVAENRLGRSEPSEVIQVTTQEEGKVFDPNFRSLGELKFPELGQPAYLPKGI